MRRLIRWLILILISLRAVSAQLVRSQLCDSGACLVASIADPLVFEVRLTRDILLHENDFADFDSTIVLDRDFTLIGAEPRPVTLDLNFLRSKIRLKPNITWYFSNVILYRYRSGSGFQAPGLDLLEPLQAGEYAWLHLESGYLLSPFCFPVKILKQALATVMRPPVYGGVNVAQVPGPPPSLPPNCTNDTSAPVLDRCYPLAALYQDFGFYGADVQPNGVMRQSGYLIRFLNWVFLCPTVLSDDCIDQLGPVGCVLFTLSGGRASAPPPLPVVTTPAGTVVESSSSGGGGSGAGGGGASSSSAGGKVTSAVATSGADGANGAGAPRGAAAAGPGAGGSDSGGRRRLAIILSCVLGGLAALAVLTALVLRAARTGKQHRQQRPWTVRLGPGSAAKTRGRGASPGQADRAAAAPSAADVTSQRSPKAPFASREQQPGPHPEADEFARELVSEGRLPRSYISEPSEADVLRSLAAAPVARSAPGGPDVTRSATDCALVTETTTATAGGGGAAAATTTGAFAALTSSTSLFTSPGSSGPVGAIVTPDTPLRPDLRFGIRLRTIGLRAAGAQFRSGTARQGSDLDLRRPVGRPDAVPAAAAEAAATAAATAAAAVGVKALHGHAMPVPGQVAGGMTASSRSRGWAPGSDAAGEGDSSGGGGSRAAAAEADHDVVALTPRVLGKGASGRVYEGEYRGMPVAVKVLLGFGAGFAAAHPAPAVRPGQQHAGRSAEALHPRNTLGLPQSPGLHALPAPNSHLSSASGDTLRRSSAQLQRQRRPPPHQPGHSMWPQNQGLSNLSLVLAAEPGAGVSSTSGGVTSLSLESCSGHGSFFTGSGGNRGHCSGRGSAPALSLGGQVPEGAAVHLPPPAVQAAAAAAAAAAADAAASTAVDSAGCGGTDDVAASPSVAGAEAASAAFWATGDPRFEAIFLQEVEVLGRCQHPNIVRLLAACVTPPRLCLVMELMEGSLAQLLYGGTVRELLPLDKVLHIAAEVCHGLAYLHPTIIHRDLKPANVLINAADSATPVVKLSDFGLARIRSATLPTERVAAGTPAYLAPECFDTDNNVVTHHVDIFALGVLLWTMLTGQEPWKNHSAVAVGYKVTVLGERLPLEQLSSRRCPSKLRQLIAQCWEGDPRRRPAAAEVAKELLVLREKVLLGFPTRRGGLSVSSALTDLLRTAGAALFRSGTAVGASRPAAAGAASGIAVPQQLAASFSDVDCSRAGTACGDRGGGEEVQVVRAASALEPGAPDVSSGRAVAGRLPLPLAPTAVSDAAADVAAAAAAAGAPPAVGDGPPGERELALGPAGDRLIGEDTTTAGVEVCGEVPAVSTVAGAGAALGRTAAEDAAAVRGAGLGGPWCWQQEGLKLSSSDCSVSEGTLNRMMADVELEME